jgi:hypothetical protein
MSTIPIYGSKQTHDQSYQDKAPDDPILEPLTQNELTQLIPVMLKWMDLCDCFLAEWQWLTPQDVHAVISVVVLIAAIEQQVSY